MAKALRVPVLVFENKEEVELLANCINFYELNTRNKINIEKIEALKDEIKKIIIIFEKTNNN